MTDNITLPREVVEKIHEAWSSEVYPPAASTEWYDIMDALRTALAAEPMKQEPGLMEGLAELARQMKPLDADMAAILHDNLDSLYIEDEPALAAEQPKPEPVAWFLPQPLEVHYYSAKNQALQREVETLRRDAERLKDAMRKAMAMLDKHEPEPAGAFAVLLLALNPELQSAKNAAPPATHPGYVIGSHWLETAYSRICAGEAEADVLRDCGWERVDDIEAMRRDADIEALRRYAEALQRDAERYRYLRNRDPKEVFNKSGKAAGVWIDWEDDMAGLQLLTGDDADAAIDAAMEGKR